MSKKPRRSRHRVPSFVGLISDPIDDRYQAEIDRSVSKLETRYRKAEKALEAAEAKAQRARERAASLERKKAAAKSVSQSHAALARLEAQVADRRRELLAIEQLMMPASHSSRDGRRRRVRHESAGFDINLSSKGAHK